MNKFLVLILLSALIGCSEKYEKTNFAIITPNDTPETIIKKAANIVPTERQLKWQGQELTAFIHYTVNTFTDREWGDGIESPDIFYPSELDANQWVKVIKNAGFKSVILTCKHHDGFCLWPTATTKHSVKYSKWGNGGRDIVKEVSDACNEMGIGFGVYISPWDRHEPSYGNTPVYNDFFKKQLTELLTNYGIVTEVWFDGACGEREKGQEYDWDGFYQLIRELQPQACISIMGPDVRWVGTESGYGRETEWSVVPMSAKNQDQIAEESQQNESFNGFTPKDLTEQNIGGRDAISKAKSLTWYPAVVNTSIRPGWFYHASQDSLVKSPGKLLEAYFASVGRNGVFLLNFPPDKRGLIADADIKSIMEWRTLLDNIFDNNLLEEAKIKYSGQDKTSLLVDADPYSSIELSSSSTEKAQLLINFNTPKSLNIIELQENIKEGQRVERFIVEYFDGDNWHEVVDGTTIGYKRLLHFPEVSAKQFRIRILESRFNPAISEIGFYYEKNLPADFNL